MEQYWFATQDPKVLEYEPGGLWVLDRFKKRKEFLPAETSLFQNRSHRPLWKRSAIGNNDKPRASGSAFD